MFTWTFITIEALASVGLVFLVLLHSGRGGGISDLLGGSMGSAASGSTVVERNLDRITIAVALIFTFATLTLDLRLQ
ncbi:MAG TPA: preprotein translocase subunit SecG [Acidimicrobiales bacterium]|jgi:preprotein translocase subunit SecG|nr:preprotein translocase subunit SecG [Acidimicrobiales bacterium]